MRGPLFTDTITLYNRVRSGRVETWCKTVLNGVQVQQKSLDAVTATGESVFTTETRITIPYEDHAGFVTPEQYAGAGWTLRREDIVVIGECSDVPSAQMSIDDIKKAHAGVVIKEATDDTRRPRLRVWKARCV